MSQWPSSKARRILARIAKQAGLTTKDLWCVRDQVTEMAEIEEACDEEVEQRLAAYDRGDVEAVDGEEVLARARALAQR